MNLLRTLFSRPYLTLFWTVTILVLTLTPAADMPDTPTWELLSFDTAAHAAVFALLAALAWAAGNMVSRAAGRVDALAYMVWSSVFAIPPLVVLSLWLEGWPAVRQGLQQAGWLTWAAVLWQSVGNTLFGYGVWAWLLARYPAASVTPLALLVPVFGMSASAWWLAEPLPGWKIVAALLVIGGLALNMLWPRMVQQWRRLAWR